MKAEAGFLLLFLLQTGCATFQGSLPDIKDGGFLSEQPCGPPCFYNIRPGITREAEVAKIFATNSPLQRCEPFNNESISGNRGLACYGIVNVSFGRGTDVVESIGFQPSQPITMRQIIAKYGRPDRVFVSNSSPSGRIVTGMGFYYEKIQAGIGMGEQPGRSFYLWPDTKISGIGYGDNSLPSPVARDYEYKGYGQYEVPLGQ
jgi:hypothetical protein